MAIHMRTPSFIPGVELYHRFYWEAVRPVLDTEFPGLRHSAALIGPGSEVLGFDTPVWTDHHWGSRAMLFLEDGKRSSPMFDLLRLPNNHPFGQHEDGITGTWANDRCPGEIPECRQDAVLLTEVKARQRGAESTRA